MYRDFFINQSVCLDENLVNRFLLVVFSVHSTSSEGIYSTSLMDKDRVYGILED